jgi:hypothetical protein
MVGKAALSIDVIFTCPALCARTGRIQANSVPQKTAAVRINESSFLF